MSAAMAPRMRHRVSFDAPITVRDSSGNQRQEWLPITSLQNVPAEVLTGPGKESIPAAQPLTTVAARITLRYQSSLAACYGMRVDHNGAEYHVESYFFDAGCRRWVTLVCSTGAKHV